MAFQFHEILEKILGMIHVGGFSRVLPLTFTRWRLHGGLTSVQCRIKGGARVLQHPGSRFRGPAIGGSG